MCEFGRYAARMGPAGQAVEQALQALMGMYVSLDQQQATTLRDLIQDTLKQTRIESARTDTHDFREMLHERERVLESLLVKLADTPLS